MYRSCSNLPAIGSYHFLCKFKVLPLLTLYQYFTTYVCRDLQRAVDGRILKVRVLTDLGLFSEAVITLIRLLHGDRLPHIGDSNFRQVESKMPTICFDSRKPLQDANNLKVGSVVRVSGCYHFSRDYYKYNIWIGN